MNKIHKTQITDTIKRAVKIAGSQNALAKKIAVSSATISQILKGEWDLIADDMWRSIGSQLGWSTRTWKAVETQNYKIFTGLLKDAQKSSKVFAIIGNAGTGKSYAAANYARTNKRTYLIRCVEYWTRKNFLSDILRQMGREYRGFTVAEMMTEIVDQLKKQDGPLLILDEVDKLSDRVLKFFITLYNELEDICGIVLTSTDHLKKRIDRGLKYNKMGYKEIYSRIGRKFISLDDIRPSDVTMICTANGVKLKRDIKEVYEDCEGDLRRVKRKIHALTRAVA